MTDMTDISDMSDMTERGKTAPPKALIADDDPAIVSLLASAKIPEQRKRLLSS